MWIAFSLLCCKQISIEHRISTIHKLTSSAIALFLTSKALRTTQSSKTQKDYHHAKVKWDFITGFKETERRRNGVAKILGSEEYFTQKNEIYRCFLCVCVYLGDGFQQRNPFLVGKTRRRDSSIYTDESVQSYNSVLEDSLALFFSCSSFCVFFGTFQAHWKSRETSEAIAESFVWWHSWNFYFWFVNFFKLGREKHVCLCPGTLAKALIGVARWVWPSHCT